MNLDGSGALVAGGDGGGMVVIEDAFRASDLPVGGVGTIGNYDGVHRGQRSVIDRVIERARAAGAPSVVVTFEPHPLAVLRPAEAPPRLTTPAEKLGLLEAAGVDATLVVRFTRDLARTSAREFVTGFLHGRLGLSEIHVGEGFHFGHRREGSLALLRELGDDLGFEAFAAPVLRQGGERVSSTRIRRAVAEGRVEDAWTLLGRPYHVAGTVVRGERMGQRLGWPTINLDLASELLPADGVYAGRVHLPEFPGTFDCVTNIGTRPTVYETYDRVVESHILDFAADVYGHRAEVRFHKHLRQEQMFPTIMDLSAQIRRDVQATREYFSARRRLEGEKPAPSGDPLPEAG